MYSELHCKTNYSFLTGGSHADELVERAIALGYRALAITDENTLAGVVRAYSAVQENNQKQTADANGENPTQLKLIIGAEIVPNDAPPVLLWATDRKSYGNLSRLITVGRRRAPKGECWLSLADIADHASGLLAGVLPGFRGDRLRTEHIDKTHPSYQWHCSNLNSHPENETEQSLFTDEKYAAYREIFDDRSYLMAAVYRGIDDSWRIEQLKQLSQRTNLPLVASGDVLYHTPARLPLHDVLTAIKHRTTVASATDLLLPNAQRHLQSIAERKKAFAAIPEAIQRIDEIVQRCNFCLSQLRYEYPIELAPNGQKPIEYLHDLTQAGANDRYPDGVPTKVKTIIAHELKLIKELRYEAYFLTVWDLVRFARGRDILCQGRGSAANSAVCYCLGITSVDPDTSELLFERFISKERDEAPDIDVDFEHERREEVLQ